MEFQVGDIVRIEPALLGTSLAATIGDKASRLVGKWGIVEDILIGHSRPFGVHVEAEGGAVYIRLRKEELSLVAPAVSGLRFGAFAIERMQGLAPA